MNRTQLTSALLANLIHIIHANPTPFSMSSVSFSLLTFTSSAFDFLSSSNALFTSARSGSLGSVIR